MPSAGNIVYYSAVAAWAALIYQFLIKDLLSVTLGLGRVIQSIDDFPYYSCSRIHHPQLEACEDLWLDQHSRTLYAACAGTQSRIAWNPSISHLNASGRRPSGTDFLAIDFDSLHPNATLSLRTITPTGSFGATNPPTLDTVGFTAEPINSTTIHFYLTNVAPYHGALFPATEIGANASIEIFSHTRNTSEMTHLRTIFSPSIYSPNRPAILPNGALLITNDHSVKTGWRKHLDPIIGGGNVVHCPSPSSSASSPSCFPATPPPNLDIRQNLKFPNGLARGPDGNIYVPSSIDGTVGVFTPQPNGSLTRVHTIPVGMPLDNITPDARGHLWVVGFPNLLKTVKAMGEGKGSPGTVFRITRYKDVFVDDGEDRYGDEYDYDVEKEIEDREGRVIDGATTVVRDSKTGRLVLGGAVAGFLVGCELRAGV